VGGIIACANQKGGVGKTTTVISLGAYLALSGRRVLLVDLDPQGNATSGLGIDRAALDASVYDVLLADRPLDETVVASAVSGLDVLPSQRSLAGAEVELVPISGRERRLKQVLDGADLRWDIILLDCPPSLGLLTVNALTAAHSVLVPLQCEYLALEGLSQLMATIELVRQHLNPGLSLIGVVLTMHDGRTSLAADVTQEVRHHLGPAVFDTIVPRSVRLAEAPSYGQAIPQFSPSSSGAVAYEALSHELIGRYQAGHDSHTASTEPALAGASGPSQRGKKS
jgi:chromosome partitioning protein